MPIGRISGAAQPYASDSRPSKPVPIHRSLCSVHLKAIESVESEIHNVGDLCNSGRSSHVIDGFEITDELNAGFASEMVAWKAAIKHLGKRTGVDSKELHSILEGTFLALKDEFSWTINGNECGIVASDWVRNDSKCSSLVDFIRKIAICHYFSVPVCTSICTNK